VSLVVFFIVVLGAELLRLSYTALTVQYAATRVMRSAIVGPPVGAGVGYNHAAAIEGRIIELSSNLGVSIGPEHVRICPDSDPQCEIDNTGESNQIIIIQIARPMRILIYEVYTIEGLVVGRNEPYPEVA